MKKHLFLDSRKKIKKKRLKINLFMFSRLITNCLGYIWYLGFQHFKIVFWESEVHKTSIVLSKNKNYRNICIPTVPRYLTDYFQLCVQVENSEEFFLASLFNSEFVWKTMYNTFTGTY